MGLASVSSPSPPQLSLDLKPPSSGDDNNNDGWTPTMISEFLREVSMIPDASERVSRIDEFLGRLEQEYMKIQMLQRELPLSMLLLKDGITLLKEESRQWKKKNTKKPVLEEFIPVARKGSRWEEPRKKSDREDDLTDESRDKRDWLQLWSADGLPAATQNNSTLTSEKQGHNNLLPLSLKVDGKRRRFTPDNNLLMNNQSNGVLRGEGEEEEQTRPIIKAASHVFPKMTQTTPPDAGLSLGIMKHSHQETLVSSKPRLGNGRLIVAADSPAAFVGSSNIVNSNAQHHLHPTNRKQRRCWSPELHRRFVNALQQLGGAQVATPKQIRELMQVDGLTNDEVKSHLQKYRLHTRRAPANSLPQEHNSETTSKLQQQQHGRSSSPPSGSPESPFHFGLSTGGGTSTTGGDSMEDHEESEGYS